MSTRRFIALALLLIISQSIFSQSSGTDWKLMPRFSFYSSDDKGEVLLTVPSSAAGSETDISVLVDENIIGSWKGKAKPGILKIPVTINLKPGSYTMKAVIRSGNTSRTSVSPLKILNYKSNEVRIDRLTGGLIVNKRQFFPFGFYCYSPVSPTLPDEERTRGFNMISPYQKILPSSLKERKAYMDRCAQIGMKVHYNVLSVAGGGGVSSKIEGISAERKKELLVNEIKTFMDHPALLAWYIADEPNARKVEPDSLKQIYDLVTELDPWHPVTMVFTAPYLTSVKYLGALDIAMADPYPIPDLPASFLGKLTTQLSQKYNKEVPLWMVLQTFGGGEIWKREPTWQEIRSMTYQAIINGAKGIQYFVRSSPNLFPKSVPSWGECGKIATEISELTPWLLTDEESSPVSAGNEDVSARSYIHNGKMLVLAVNKSNEPARVSISIPHRTTGKAEVIFENRSIPAGGSTIPDILSPFGAQAYLVDIERRDEKVKPWEDNLVYDPGFEENPSLGVPSACYARGNIGGGATYFTDTRESIEGSHSVRLITPVENGSSRLRFYPFRVRPGASYIVSIWAKSDPEQGLSPTKNQNFEIWFGDFDLARFTPTSEWKEYKAIFKVPFDDDVPGKLNLTLQLPSAGVCWFDLLQAAECSDIKNCIDPALVLAF